MSIYLDNSEKTKIEDFRYVGGILNRNGFTSSSVLIKDGKFAITAKHAVTIDGCVDGKISDFSDIFFVIRENDESSLVGVVDIIVHKNLDIAILKLEKKQNFSATIISNVDKNEIFYGVGYGKTSSNPFSNPVIFDKYDGKKRFFKNRLIEKEDGFLEFDLSKKETLGLDGGAIPGEGMIGIGDSGGGMFVKREGKLNLVGILVSVTTNSDSDGNFYLFGNGIHINKNIENWIDLNTR